jgi:quercetin dioxygenase-like cupin family protein
MSPGFVYIASAAGFRPLRAATVHSMNLCTAARTAQPFPTDPKGEPSMNMHSIPFGTTDWSSVEKIEHAGIGGVAHWRTRQFSDIRVRMVEYSPGYLADHWCSKGHILLVLEGELETELADGRRFTLKPGMSYQVADGAEPHRSFTRSGAKLFIVD